MSAAHDRTFTDARPMFDVAIARAADPLHEDRKDRALLSVARGLAQVGRDLPDVGRKSPAFDAVGGALLRAYIEGMKAGRAEGTRLVEHLLGDYLPRAAPADFDAIERFVGFIREQYGMTDADLADD